MSKPKCAVCFLGPPAAGKGTTSIRIAEEFGYPIITPGNIYKELREQDTEIGRLVKDTLKDGGLCPTWLTNKLMLEEGMRVWEELRKPFIYDGYPRTVEQYEFMNENFDVGLVLHVITDIPTMRKMAVNRRNCQSCKSVFSVLDTKIDCPYEKLYSNGTVEKHDKDDPFPENCAIINTGSWQHRWDDTEELFDKRYQTYLRETDPITKLVEHMPNYMKVDVMADLTAVGRVFEKLRELAI